MLIKKQSKQSSFNRIVFSSKSYKWNTPDEIIKDLDQEFHFEFDPAIPPRFGNFNGNALKDPWHGRTFCNPPYKRKLIDKWIWRAWMQFKNGNCELVVLLIPFRNSKWFQFLRRKGAEFRLCDKRLKFSDAKEGAPFDSVIAILK